MVHLNNTCDFFVYGNIFFHLKQNLIVGEYPFNHTMLDTAIAR